MAKYTHVLLDLDGTLIDPKIGITTGVQHGLRAVGIEESDLAKLLPFIGPPLRESFTEFYGLTSEQIAQAVEGYRGYFGEFGVFENELYPGVVQMLQRLVNGGKTVCLATSKPAFFAEQILEHHNIRSFFTFVGGANMDETRTLKAEVVRHVMDQFPGVDATSYIMVGDRKHDVEGAREHGISTLSVLYGYGSKEELEAAEPAAIVDSVSAVADWILK